MHKTRLVMVMVAVLIVGAAYFSTWEREAAAAPFAPLITFHFTGVIDSPSGDFFAGEPVSGLYTFDASTPPTPGAGGSTEYMMALTDFQVTVGGDSFSSLTGDITVQNDVLADPSGGIPLYMDQYLVTTGTVVGNPLPSGLTISFAQLDVRAIVEDDAPDFFVDGVMPTDPVDLSLASEAGGRLFLSSGDQAEFVLTSLTAFRAQGTAIIDGVFSPLEWDNASRAGFLAAVHSPNGEETTTPAVVFVMNDAVNLYLGVKVERPDLGNSSVGFEFDNDNSGDRENGDDSLVLNAGIHFFSDNVRTNQPPCPSAFPGACGFVDTDLGGTLDGEGVASSDGTFAYYEISHPLDSADDLYDFSLSEGDESGFQLHLVSCLPLACAETFFPGPGPFDPRATVGIAEEPIVADLRVTNDTDIGPMPPGDDVLYRIAVENVEDDEDEENPEPNPAPGVVLTIPLPAEVAFVSADPDPMCSYRLGTHLVTCELGTLAPAESAEVFLVVKIDLLARDPIDIIATATFDGVDSDLLNNSAAQTTEVKAYQDLFITKVGNPDPVVGGFPLTYAIEVENLGPHVATDMTVLDQFPPGLGPADLSRVWISSWGTGCTLGFDFLQCNVGDIDPGDTAEVIFVVDVPATLSGYFSNTASVWANEEEVFPADNRVTYEVYVAPSVNTPVGGGLSVFPTDTNTGSPEFDVSVVFTDVTQAGTTTVTETTAGTPPPDGFSLGDPAVYYDFETDAVFVAPVQICINYIAAGIAFSGEPRFFHFEAGAWVDRTTFHDPVAGVICAEVDSLSPFAVFATDELQVTVDIKPESSANTVNLRSNGLIPVAVLSEGTFDATDVDVASVSFGPSAAKAAHRRGHVEDVDGDGDLDLLLHFATQRAGIGPTDTTACLSGGTKSGVQIRGCDSVRVVGG